MSIIFDSFFEIDNSSPKNENSRFFFIRLN